MASNGDQLTCGSQLNFAAILKVFLKSQFVVFTWPAQRNERAFRLLILFRLSSAVLPARRCLSATTYIRKKKKTKNRNWEKQNFRLALLHVLRRRVAGSRRWAFGFGFGFRWPFVRVRVPDGDTEPLASSLVTFFSAVLLRHAQRMRQREGGCSCCCCCL